MATFLTGISVGGSGGSCDIIQTPAWTAKSFSFYAQDNFGEPQAS